jgi:hypothetical protein
VVGGLDVVGTRGHPALVEDGRGRGVDGLPAEVRAMGCRGVELVAVWQCWSGRRRSGGAGTRVCPARVGGRNLVLEGGSWEVPVALRDVANQPGAERDNPGEAGGDAVAVGVAGDEMVGEQSGDRLVKVTCV